MRTSSASMLAGLLLAAGGFAPTTWAADTPLENLLERNHELMVLRQRIDGALVTDAGYDRDIAKKLVREHKKLIATLTTLDGNVGHLAEADAASRAKVTADLEESCRAARVDVLEVQATLATLATKKDKPTQLVAKNDLDGYGALVEEARGKLDTACALVGRVEAAETAMVAAGEKPPAVELAQTRHIKIDAMDLTARDGTRETYRMKARVRGGIAPEDTHTAVLLYPLGGGDPEKAATSSGKRDLEETFTVDRARHDHASFLVKDSGGKQQPDRHEVEIWINPDR